MAAILLVVGTCRAQSPPPPDPYRTMTQESLLKAAEQGDAKAQNELAARALRTAVPPGERATQAARWWRASADQGNPVGQAFLGDFYRMGLGVPQNKTEALRLFRLSAEQGFPPGQYFLGRAYLRGDGVVQDFNEASNWIGRAAAANYPDAQNDFGGMYANGQGLPKDDTEAAKWFRRAAERGHAPSQANLGRMYASGRGVPQDNIEAYFWTNLAVAHLPAGSPEAVNARATVADTRDQLAKRLSVAELERAQNIAFSWKPGDPVEEPLHRGLSQTRAPVTPSPRPAPGPAGSGQTAARQPALPKPSPVISGTGFVVSPSGHVLTNAHVLDQCREIRARLPGETPVTATLVATDRLNDLAIAKLPTPAPAYATFRSEPNLKQGESIVVYGFPLSGMLAADGNLTTGNISALAGLANDSRMLQISAPVQSGNSGGPLVDMSGNVVGVVVSKLNTFIVGLLTGDMPQNVNFAIKSNVAIGFLDASNIPYQTSASSKPMEATEVAERAKKFILNIECRRAP